MTWGCGLRHAPEARAEDFEKSQLVYSDEEGWLSLARSGLVAGATRIFLVGGGADGKTGIERLCLSLYIEKPFNSRVIKCFVSELRSHKCFSCFGNPMFYVYMLWTFYVRFTYPYSCMAMLENAIQQNKLIELYYLQVVYIRVNL